MSWGSPRDGAEKGGSCWGKNFKEGSNLLGHHLDTGEWKYCKVIRTQSTWKIGKTQIAGDLRNKVFNVNKSPKRKNFIKGSLRCFGHFEKKFFSKFCFKIRSHTWTLRIGEFWENRIWKELSSTFTRNLWWQLKFSSNMGNFTACKWCSLEKGDQKMLLLKLTKIVVHIHSQLLKKLIEIPPVTKNEEATRSQGSNFVNWCCHCPWGES